MIGAAFPRTERRAVSRVAATVALVLGLGHAAVSVYWLCGGTALLSTLGEQLERWGRQRSAGGLVVLGCATLAKIVAALHAAVAVGFPPFGHGTRAIDIAASRAFRWFGWLVAIALASYGAVMTAAGVLADRGVIRVDVEQPGALRWHAYFWDPWFLLWGCAQAVVMITSRAARPARDHQGQSRPVRA